MSQTKQQFITTARRILADIDVISATLKHIDDIQDRRLRVEAQAVVTGAGHLWAVLTNFLNFIGKAPADPPVALKVRSADSFGPDTIRQIVDDLAVVAVDVGSPFTVEDRRRLDDAIVTSVIDSARLAAAWEADRERLVDLRVILGAARVFVDRVKYPGYASLFDEMYDITIL